MSPCVPFLRYTSSETPPSTPLQVDREKAQLEEEQRLLRCHAKEKSPEYEEWRTKSFHKRPVVDPISGECPCHNGTVRCLLRAYYSHMGTCAGKTVELFTYDHTNFEAHAKGEAEADLISLSRNLPDIRGGIAGTGADASVVALQRSITLSSKRVADLAALDAAAASK